MSNIYDCNKTNKTANTNVEVSERLFFIYLKKKNENRRKLKFRFNITQIENIPIDFLPFKMSKLRYCGIVKCPNNRGTHTQIFR